MTDEGPLTRDELRDRVHAAGVETAGQALVHLLMLACLRGIAVRGPFRGKQHAYVLAHDWLGRRRPVARERALAELARRYLEGHAPADDRDLAKWAGLPLRDARAGLGAIAAEVARAPRPARAEANATRAGSPRACLLDQWDPLLVGWRSRESLLDRYPRRDSPEAHFRPFAYVRRTGRRDVEPAKRRGHDRRAVRAGDSSRRRRRSRPTPRTSSAFCLREGAVCPHPKMPGGTISRRGRLCERGRHVRS